MPTISPQPGAQTKFLASSADIVLYGGAAGGGKSFAILLEPLRHVSNPGFRAVVFRRTSPQITAGGGLWDTAGRLYPACGGVANQSALKYRFPSGAEVKFTHIKDEKTKYDHDGSQYAFIGFDELIHFTRSQFFYLLSRNRSLCGVRPYIRATCNPDSTSWVKQFIAWWLDPVTGLSIPERDGVLRWFVVINDEPEFFDSEEQAKAAHPDIPAKSLTFIAAKLSDNAILCQQDPGYKANLMALSWVERARLLGGNWNASASDGLFQADWFSLPVSPEHTPRLWKRQVRSWDLAATEQKDSNDPDWLACVLMAEEDTGRDANNKPNPPRYWILDAERHRISPLKVKRKILEVAMRDGENVEVVLEQEAAASGKVLASEFRELLQGTVDLDGQPKPSFKVYIYKPDKTTGDKATRAFPFSASCERGEVKLVAGAWNKPFLGELCQFPTKGVHDDWVDAAGAAHRRLSSRGGMLLV